ncbi:MAG TPA: DUF1802 family protein [Acidimicrobiia bacterium]|nr:DUF1802 family protein [Acidimicrobiia bacterium]
MSDDAQIGSTPALKEWAVICHALLAGEQIVDVRKGGIREAARTGDDGRSRRAFGLPATRCWLYPTVEHQRAELLKEPYRHWIDLASGAPVGEPIRIHGWAEIVEVATITEPDHLAALESKLIWTHDYAASRLDWKARDPLWILVLRAHRLVDPLVVPWDDGYGGCTSWVELSGLPSPDAVASEPALSDVAFEARLKGVRESLPAGALAPPA